MNRSGGVAEFPNVTLDIQCSEDYSGRAIEVELATQPDPIHVKNDFERNLQGPIHRSWFRLILKLMRMIWKLLAK